MNNRTNEQPTTTATTQSITTPTHVSGLASRSTLWASAAVLFALVLLQSQPLIAQMGGGTSAHAGMVSQTAQLTVMTTEAGNEDVLMVLDGRSEELSVYRTDPLKGMTLVQRMNLPQSFTDARARFLGRE